MKGHKLLITSITMTYIKFAIFSVSFKIVCGLAACFMIGYWVQRYHEDEDKKGMEFKDLKSSLDMPYPELSLCITNPFIPEKFKNHHSNVTMDDYRQYIRGNGTFHENYNKINYSEVTLNILEYVSDVRVTIDGKPWIKHFENCTGDRCSFLLRENNFNGFVYGDFNKCFSIGFEQRCSESLSGFKVNFRSELTHILHQMKSAANDRYDVQVSTTLSYPKQFLATNDHYNIIWQTLSSQGTGEWIIIKAMDVLIRRNTIGEPCDENWKIYDKLVLKEHISSVECKSPYLNHTGSLCNTTEEVIDSMYDADAVKDKYHIHSPCQEATDIKYTSHQVNDGIDGTLYVKVIYPNFVKVISEVQSIDIHTLIGSIGGYIGLFLGTIYKSL